MKRLIKNGTLRIRSNPLKQTRGDKRASEDYVERLLCETSLVKPRPKSEVSVAGTSRVSFAGGAGSTAGPSGATVGS